LILTPTNCYTFDLFPLNCVLLMNVCAWLIRLNGTDKQKQKNH